MKKINLYFTMLLVLLSGLSVAAQTLSAEALLSRDIMLSAKSLDSDKKIYNYFYIPKVYSELESEKGRHSFVDRYLSERAGSFWDANFTDASTKNYAAGAGLYFAIDPLISKSYGNTFIEVIMPAGTRFINVVSPIPLKKDTMAALIAEGYMTADQVGELFPKRAGFYRDTLRAMVLPQYTHFRKMVQNIFTTQNIQFIEYNFNSSLSTFCSKHSYSAFVYIGSHTETSRGLSMFSTELNLPNQSASEAVQLQAIVKFRNILDNLAVIGKKGRAAVKEYILSQYSAAEYLAVKKSAYSCE
ncbi:MAG: hypothetical protein H7328_08320 [Bdellovibrio sp.]|nr:hypothetical protein [Bdellovibrio sp.]